MDTTNTSESAAPNRTTVERTTDREIVVTRTFDAPAHLVFEAWSTADLFRQWWIPRSLDMTLHACEMDVRTGGTYRLDFGGGIEFFGRYLDVEAPSRIVWTNDEGDESSITTVTFEEHDGRTLLVMTEVYPTKEALDEAGTGAAEATHETFAQLDELLTSRG